MAPVFIISGTPGSGKSTIARALLQRFERGIHVSIDDLREWVVSGIAHPVPQWTDETTRQFRLAFKSSAQVAKNYAEAGFAVAVHQVLYPDDVRKYIEPELAAYQPVKVFLCPSLEECLARNAARSNKVFDTAVLAEPIKAMYPELQRQMADAGDWLLIDSSKKSVAQTVDEILQRVGLA